MFEQDEAVVLVEAVVVGDGDGFPLAPAPDALEFGVLIPRREDELFRRGQGGGLAKGLGGHVLGSQGHGRSQGRQHREGPVAGPGAQLTARQGQILSMLLQALPNKRIADELSVSENTVKEHVTAILQKLSVSNRVELITKLRGMTLAQGMFE